MTERDPKYDILFEPIKVGPKVLRNRFYQAPHCVGFGAERPGAEAYLRAMKAEGGWAVVNTEGTLVSPEDDYAGITNQSKLSDSLQVRNLALMAEKVHEHGALAGVELLCLGELATGFSTRLPARTPSGLPNIEVWMSAMYEMDKTELRELQQFYVSAARRARLAGFDFVNITGAEGSGMPLLFLMKKDNRRTDEYGGSFRNRARFWLELLEMVREAVSDECALATRFCVDTLHGTDDGIRVEDEGIEFIELADDLVDLWDLQVGGPTLDQWSRDIGPSRFTKENFQGEWVRKARAATRKPIVGVGRFTNPDTMVDVIRSGQLDIIGCARPSIADPFLPKKIEEGRHDEIRECIGCNVCVSRVFAGSYIICTQNATMGEEYRRGWHPERFTPATNRSKSVLIIGAGPAGMEAAITLAKRGFEAVHLVDSAEHIGGHFRWVPRLPGLAEWGRVVDWRQVQLDKLPAVQIITNTELDLEGVLSYGAEIVICATGAKWSTDGFNGHTRAAIPGADASLPYVLTPEQIMSEGKVVPGHNVVVYDTEGYFVGVSVAEKLARDGYAVSLVTPMAGPAMYMSYTGEALDMMPLLAELNVSIYAGHDVTSIEQGRVLAVNGATSIGLALEADAVVLSTQRIPRNDLYRALNSDPQRLADAGIAAVYRAGDCWAPRMQVADAIFDAHRLAREIDQENPRKPLPYIREERLIGSTDEDFDQMLTIRGPGHERDTRLRRTITPADILATEVTS